jgi:hypothetical protein
VVNRWIVELLAPEGEAVILADLFRALESWRGIKKHDDQGRRWTLNEARIELGYRGRSKRKDLCDRIRVSAYGADVKKQARLQRFADWVTSELGWKQVRAVPVEKPESRQRQLKRMYKEKEEASARQRLGLSEEQLSDLLGFLDGSIWGLGMPCDHSLVRTEEWARENRLKVETVLSGVQHFGGHCDCTVAMNCRPYRFGWEDS